MMYWALFVAPGKKPLAKSVIWESQLLHYHASWGKVDDVGVVAKKGDAPIGAAWCRTFPKDLPGYGFVSEDTPEMVIALKEGYRNQGTGTYLLNTLFSTLRKRGGHSLSLSVHKLNPAIRLYRRLGFEVYSHAGDAYTMVKRL